MNEISVILPNQLFEDNPCLSKDRTVFLVEDKCYFQKYKFHKNKLILHRASMKYYENLLKKQGYKTNYVEYHQAFTPQSQIIHIVQPYDFEVKNNFKNATFYNSPSFISDPKEFKDIFKDKKHYSQASFYISQRKKYQILLDKNGKALGGKWSYDIQNRKKINTKTSIPKIKNLPVNEYLKEAKTYIQQHFPDNFGTTNHFIYPITHKETRIWLEDFLKNRLSDFGTYEDAVVENEAILFHSCLSSSLNSGLITPMEVITKTLEYSQEQDIPLNSLEGFIRQIIGWREFIKNIYCIEGERMKNSNFFQHNNKIPKKFYSGQTGIKPIDEILSRTLKYSYNHHIERLMFLGNFLFMCEIDPAEIHKWFMEMYIDAYEWVMVPNIFGMSQYADKGKIVTKPYISSSNYLLKMSNYKKGEWCEIFDGLYWRFINKNKEVFKQNPRLRIMYFYLQNISKEKLQKHHKTAENFLEKFLN